MTAGNNFNFENFITQNTLNEEKQYHPNAIGAVSLGISNTNLTFNQDVTVEIQVSSAYNDMELDVLSQLENSSTRSISCEVIYLSDGQFATLLNASHKDND